MNAYKKIFLGLMIATVAVLSSWADDFSFDDIMANDSSTDANAGATASPLEITGQADLPFRLSVNDLDDKSAWQENSTFNLGLNYTTDKADFVASLNLDKSVLSKYPEDLFDQLYTTYYINDSFDFSLGFQKVIWGKGDKLHVLDLVNPTDLTDFYNKDYLDQKLSQFLAKLDVAVGMNSKAEFVFVPTFTADRVATEGPWATTKAVYLKSLATKAVGNTAASAYVSAGGGVAGTLAMSQVADQYSEISDFTENTNSLKYSQAATRFTTSIAGQDLGFIYYYGHLRQPTVYATSTTLTVDTLKMQYDRVQVFGLEYGSVLAGFNLRGEAGYFMTDDFDGSDPNVANPSFQFLAGFDRGLPLHNLNINIQDMGKLTLMTNDLNVMDVDYNKDDEYLNNYLVTKISDTFNHEKVKPEVVTFLETRDWDGFVRPKVEWEINGNYSLSMAATFYFGDEDTDFGQFDKNDFVELKAIYRF